MKQIILKTLCTVVAVGMLTSCSGKTDETTADVTVPNEDTAVQTDKETQTDVVTETETVSVDTVISFITEEPIEYDDSWETASMEDQILATDENWSVTGKPVYKDGYMGVDAPDSMFDVAYLTPVGPEETYRFEFELNTAETEKDDKWLTLFAGLRIEGESGIADEANGLWISFKNGVLGIKGATNGTWNEGVTELPLPYSFADGFRRVCIEDDRVANVIKIYQSDDSGANVLAYKLEIAQGDGYSVINAFSWEDDFENTAQSIVLDTDLSYYSTGYVKLWNHNRGGVYIKNLAIKIA